MGRCASGWVVMQDSVTDCDRRLAAVKYLALGLCLAVFLIYGLVVG